MRAMRVAVVVPAFNEERAIGSVVRQLVPRCDWCIVVDDASRDDTMRVAGEAGARVLRHVVNRGAGAATLSGITDALRLGADIIVTFDADGQHDVQDLEALTAPLREGRADIVLGSRFLGRAIGMPPLRRLLLRGGVLFTRVLSGLWISDVTTGLRAFSRQAASELTITLDRFAHASEILDQIRTRGWRVVEVPVTIHYSAYSLAKGQSSWNSLRIVAQMLMHRQRR